jgi:hypothetical protein
VKMLRESHRAYHRMAEGLESTLESGR